MLNIEHFLPLSDLLRIEKPFQARFELVAVWDNALERKECSHLNIGAAILWIISLRIELIENGHGGKYGADRLLTI